jgi:hypothetical protein
MGSEKLEQKSSEVGLSAWGGIRNPAQTAKAMIPDLTDINAVN